MKNQIEGIVEALNHGQVVTVPTETVFGYAAALKSDQAILELMKIKERDYNSGKIFTLVPAKKSDIDGYAVVSEFAKKLIEKYMPGEITLILPKNPNFRHFYYDHFTTIGIRIPSHPLFSEILPKTGAILLTSANPKGGTPKTETGHLPSTIIDCAGEKPKIVRQGNLKINLLL